MFMATQKLPQCSRCFGTNWIDLGVIKHGGIVPQVPLLDCRTMTETKRPDKVIPDVHLYQCGGGLAHTDPNDMKQGCGRVIRATPEEMSNGGAI